MSITGIGLTIFFLGVFLFLIKNEYLFYLVVFFIPFSATAAINIGLEGQGSSIQVYLFMSTIWIMMTFISYIYHSYKKKHRVYLLLSQADVILIGFAITVLFSLIMPVYINGREIANITGRLNQYEPIVFNSKNITQYLYLLLGILFALVTEVFVNEKNFLKVIRIYSISIVFIMFWGIIELLCFYLNLTYPAFIFNNSVNEAAGGFGQVLETTNGSIKRISSVALEPSILSQTLLVLLPIYLYSFFYKWRIINKSIDLSILIILLIFIPLTTSSTGILGMLFVLIFFSINFFHNKNSLIFTVVLGISCVIILISLWSILFETAISQKADSYSALERFSTILDGWNLFLKYPVLGVGWGTVAAHDLIIKIAANTGLLGTIFFLSFLIKMSVKLRRSAKLSKHPVPSLAIELSVYTMLFCSLISGFTYYLGHLWFVFGLALALTRINKPKIISFK